MNTEVASLRWSAIGSDQNTVICSPPLPTGMSMILEPVGASRSLWSCKPLLY